MLSVDDEHCVRVIDIVRAPERAALVTEYVEGASLRAVLARAGRLTGPQALDVIRGALLGLIAVHENGLVHGDVKPDNILVDRRGRSRLIDFGLAHAPGNAPGHAWPGSPAYMSPEQVRGDPVDARADIYACAAVLFELLTGVRPFTGPDARAVMRAHVDEPVPDPRSFEPSLSDELARVCRRGLAKHPGERYATAREFLAELEDAARRRYGAAWMSGLGIGSLVGAILATRAGDTATPASAGANQGCSAGGVRQSRCSAPARVGRSRRRSGRGGARDCRSADRRSVIAAGPGRGAGPSDRVRSRPWPGACLRTRGAHRVGRATAASPEQVVLLRHESVPGRAAAGCDGGGRVVRGRGRRHRRPAASRLADGEPGCGGVVTGRQADRVQHGFGH